MRRSWKRILWLLLLFAPLSLAQGPSDGTIAGRVLIEDGRPAGGIEVTAQRIGGAGRTQTVATDEDGQFKFTGLAPGLYRLTAELAGFVVETASRATSPVRVGETATLRLVKGGVITGRVVDEAGEPLVGVQVMPERVRGLDAAAGEERISHLALSNLGQRGGQTDDRGIYRLYGLPPGVYLVSVGGQNWASLGAEELSRDSPTFHPGVTRDVAAEITLRGAEEASGIDIRHRGELGRTVSGVVAGPGDAQGNGIVTITSVEPGRFEARARVMSSRGYVLYGIPDGEYDLRAWRTEPEEGADYASPPRRVTVKGASLNGIELRMQPLASIAGRIEIEARTCEGPPARKSTVEEISLHPIPESNKRNWSYQETFSPLRRFGALPDARGEFRMRPLEPGRYFLTADLPGETLYLRAIVPPAPANARASAPPPQPGLVVKSGEALAGVVVKIAEGAASLEGRLAPRTRLHLVPAEPEAANDLLRYAETVTEANGDFRLQRLAPGKYWLLSRPATAPPPERPAAWDSTERARLRREAEAAKNELTLRPCERAKKTMKSE